MENIVGVACKLIIRYSKCKLKTSDLDTAIQILYSNENSKIIMEAGKIFLDEYEKITKQKESTDDITFDQAGVKLMRKKIVIESKKFGTMTCCIPIGPYLYGCVKKINDAAIKMDNSMTPEKRIITTACRVMAHANKSTLHGIDLLVACQMLYPSTKINGWFTTKPIHNQYKNDIYAIQNSKEFKPSDWKKNHCTQDAVIIAAIIFQQLKDVVPLLDE